jgi:hypothetical protein
VTSAQVTATKPFSFQYLDSVLEVHMLMDHIDPKSS